MDILASFLKSVPQIGKAASNIIESVAKFQDKFEDYKKEKNIDELTTIVSFLNSIRDKIGSIYESDFYTELIRKLLAQLKDKTKKENILIIDDLERIDPEHIFRLLNIFGAHIDTLEKVNKFGFDKVILVFDIENVKSIFHHKYGSDTNFEGYLDKFYSRDIFVFDGRASIEREVEKILGEVKIQNSENTIFGNLINSSSPAYRFHVGLIKAMVASSALNLRALTRRFDADYIPREYMIKSEHNIIRNDQLHIVIILDFLLNLFGTYDGLIHAITRSNINAYLNPGYLDKSNFNDEILAQLIFLIDYKQHKLQPAEFTYSDETHKNIPYAFEMISYDRIKLNLAKSFEQVVDYKHFLLKASKALKELRSNY